MLVVHTSRTVTDPAAAVEPPEQMLDIQWLAFDLDNVLYDATGWWRWMVHQLTRFGLHTDADSLRRVWEHDWLRDVQYGRADHWDQFAQFLRTLGLSRGQLGEMLVAARPRYDHLVELSRPYPLLLRTLQGLKSRRWRLALAAATAHNRAEVSRLLDRLRVRGVFDETLLSTEIGPTGLGDGVACRLAERLGLPADQIGFVGSASAELAAARRHSTLTIGLATPAHVPVGWRIEHFEYLSRIPAWQTLRQAG